jgi:CO dehydrogenase maturation factor
MKIAITGKGGVGKTTVAALLAILFEKAGYSVLAIDADPDANLASTLGFSNPSEIQPMIDMKQLIAERMGTEPGGVGAYFKLNPKVDDIPDSYSVVKGNIKLMLMGTVSQAKGGCTCPENAFLRELLNHILTERKEVVILDMEAGIEHLGRGTAEGVDAMLIVVEPTILSVETTKRIHKLAQDLGIKNIWAMGNKIEQNEDKEFIKRGIREIPCIGFIPYSEGVRKASLDSDADIINEIGKVKVFIEEYLKSL